MGLPGSYASSCVLPAYVACHRRSSPRLMLGLLVLSSHDGTCGGRRSVLFRRDVFPTHRIDYTCRDAHHLTFWRTSAAMTAKFPWTSMGVATDYRGNPRVSTANATAHGTFTTNAMAVAKARVAVLSEANSCVPIMATDGSRRQLPRKFRWKLPSQFPRPFAAIATVTRPSPRKSADVRGNCHSTSRGRPTAAISTAVCGHCHGNAPIVIHIIRHISNHLTPVMSLGSTSTDF